MSEVWDRLPYLKKNMDEGIVKCYRDVGTLIVISNITDEQKIKIEEIEKVVKGTKVIAITDQTAYFPGEETRMQCYIYLDSQSKPWIIDDDTVGFFARVVNKGWGIEENGSIGVQEVDRYLRRKK